MPRKVKTAFNGAPDRPRDHRHPRHRLHRPRQRRRRQGLRDPRRRRHVDHAARRAHALRVRRRRRRRVPEGRRGRLPHLRPPGLAARQPRPRPPEGVRRQVRHRRAAPPGRGGAQGRLGRRARLLDRRAACSSTTRRPTRPPSRRPTARPNGDLSEFERFVASERPAAAPGRLRHRPGARAARRPDARAVPRAGADHARLHRRLRPHDRRTRTSCCAGCATRRSTTCGRALGELGLGDAGADEIDRRRLLPGHRLLQARDHLARWASTPRCASAWRRCRSPTR